MRGRDKGGQGRRERQKLPLQKGRQRESWRGFRRTLASAIGKKGSLRVGRACLLKGQTKRQTGHQVTIFPPFSYNKKVGSYAWQVEGIGMVASQNCFLHISGYQSIFRDLRMLGAGHILVIISVST